MCWLVLNSLALEKMARRGRGSTSWILFRVLLRPGIEADIDHGVLADVLQLAAASDLRPRPFRQELAKAPLG